MSKKILVTGGTGFIGSHTLVDLIEKGFEVVSIDNHSRSYKESLEGVERITGKNVTNYSIDICDFDKVKKVFEEHPNFDGVIHFAAYKSVPESIAKPLLYFKNNNESLVNILQLTEDYNVPYFVFSSSCSVYGEQEKLPVTEESPLQEAECAYARTKQQGEKILKDVAAVSRTKYIALRYFNPVGAHKSAEIGERSIDPPNNLVPIITETAIGIRESMTVFGSDFDTRDGSCIRDYIHVSDIAEAHTMALQYLISNQDASSFDIVNLGTGNGVSVFEAINAFEEVSGQKLNYIVGPKREGDVGAIYSDCSKAKELFGWSTKRDILDMMRTSWEWQKKITS
jgi:UDP-glucose 4-epimerase